MLEKNKYPLKRHESQRGYFAAELYEQMAVDKDIYLICIDLGYKVFDAHMERFPDRVLSVGASEQSALGIAVGLALEGKKPFVYTISSFYMRAAETISLYINQEQIPVRMIGAGRDDDYKHDGRSHHAGVVQKFMLSMEHIISVYPQTFEAASEHCRNMVLADHPVFISLRR